MAAFLVCTPGLLNARNTNDTFMVITSSLVFNCSTGLSLFFLYLDIWISILDLSSVSIAPGFSTTCEVKATLSIIVHNMLTIGT